MRFFAVLAVLAALVGAAATLPASADCRTDCMNHAGGQQTCNTHCW